MDKRTFPHTYEQDMAWAIHLRAKLDLSTHAIARRLFIPCYLWEDYEAGARPVPDHIRRDAEHLWGRLPQI